jgi:hypothetical protein
MPPHCFTTNWMFNFLIMIVEDSYMRYLPRPSMCQKWHMQLLLLCRHRRHITYRSCAWYGHFVCRRSCLVVRVTAASMVVRRLDCRMIGPTKMVQHMTPMRGSLHLLACTSFTALLSHNIFLGTLLLCTALIPDQSFLSQNSTMAPISVGSSLPDGQLAWFGEIDPRNLLLPQYFCNALKSPLLKRSWEA